MVASLTTVADRLHDAASYRSSPFQLEVTGLYERDLR